MSFDSSENLKINSGLVLKFQYIPTGMTANFKAMLTTYQDQFTPNWNERSVFGRPDVMPTYQNTRREITLAWEVVAASIEEAKRNLTHAQRLIRMTYPVYGKERGATGIIGSPLVRMQFLNFAWNAENAGQENSFSGDISNSGLVGKLGPITFEPKLELGVYQDSQTLSILPKQMTFNCTFLVLHTHPLGHSKNGFRNLSFPYGIEDGQGTIYENSRNAAKYTAKESEFTSFMDIEQKEDVAMQETLLTSIGIGTGAGENFAEKEVAEEIYNAVNDW